MGFLEGLFNAVETALSPLSDEDAYEIVAKELAADQLDPGLWTRALSEAGFDQDKARAKYIKYRVAAVQRAATQEGVRQRAWYKDAEDNAYEYLKRGDYELATIGFVERVKKRKDPDAMHNLGWLAENGHVKDATLDDALAWYRKAVDSGRHASALTISNLLLRHKQFREAYEWAEFAHKNNVPGAREARLKAAQLAGINLRWWSW